MLYSCIVFFTALATLISTCAVANPIPDVPGTCDTGPVQCCNEVKDASDPSVQGALSGLEVTLQGAVGQVGLDCNTINIIGLLSNTGCNIHNYAHPVCCTEQPQGGLVGPSASRMLVAAQL
ncbi:hypothetical protein BD413DRAFT_668161 [Trametes elegans]|nr:hypothetical protein BD413DRAFT_668161 [Trametes elegans]